MVDSCLHESVMHQSVLFWKFQESLILNISTLSCKSWLKTQNIKKTKIIAPCSITSWQIDGKTVEIVTEFILGRSKITVDGDCNHEIKRCLLLEEKL